MKKISQTKRNAFSKYLDHVGALIRGDRARSEVELSSRLRDVFEELGLHTVLDTSPSGTRVRPDLLVYRNIADADFVLPAEIVIEAKKPEDKYKDLGKALLGVLWDKKTVPYIRANLSRIQYFILTSFTEFAIVRITRPIREQFARLPIEKLLSKGRVKNRIKRDIAKRLHILSLKDLGCSEGVAQAAAWTDWVERHLHPNRLEHIPISFFANTVHIDTEDDLEQFAERLAALAAGPEGARKHQTGLFSSIRESLPSRHEELAADTKHDLHLFIMAQNPAITALMAEQYARERYDIWIDDFVGASIHSLISRLFTLKIVEDAFCLGFSAPLIERRRWVINIDAYDSLSPDDLLKSCMQRLRGLKRSENQVLRHLTAFGAFFDWIEDYLDPVLFQSLFELFVVSDFREIESDLLGRFFELYSQRINRRKRKALGQYYTPLPIVRFMWKITTDEIAKQAHGSAITIIDLGMGSGTFLREGMAHLARLGIPKFWEHVVGFDISPQVMGIAHANVYMGTLAQLKPAEALQVNDLKLYTTDALDPNNGKHLKELTPFFSDAAHREFLERSIEISASIKHLEHFHVAIGNPPYKNNSTLTLAQMAERFPRLLQTSNSASRAQERNIRDDYAWFFAAADAYINKSGIICFITSDSYTNKQSYIHFREEILRHYHIRLIVRLGVNVFPDVFQISFAIILMERRAKVLAGHLSNIEPLLFYDLRPLADSNSSDSRVDPRLQLLDAVSRGTARMPEPIKHIPTAEQFYSLVPSSRSLIDRILKDSVPVTAKGTKGTSAVFRRKWPGIITAFDALLRDETADMLANKLSDLFSISVRHASSTRARQKAVEEFAAKYQFSDEKWERLLGVSDSIVEQKLQFDASKIKLTFAGSIPNDKRWYPPPEFRCAIYYEPSISFERNDNAGKEKGWGDMGQWREPDSHLISPKLVFSTSTNPSFGYKAFVLDDRWYVKLHGGKSQQYHYTGLSLADGSDNLDHAGADMVDLLKKRGGLAKESLLIYVSAIFNSSIAEEFLEEEPGHLLHIKEITAKNISISVRIIEYGRQLHAMHRLLYDGPLHGIVDSQTVESLAPQSVLELLGATRRTTKSKRFRQGAEYELPVRFKAGLVKRISEIQGNLDEAVATLYA